MNDRLYALLAYSGTLPFVACTFLLAAGAPDINGFNNWAEIAAGYGLAIVAFMAGVHWGMYMQPSPSSPLNLLLTSNALTVAVWLTFVLAPTSVSLIATGLAFALLLGIDYRLADAGMMAPAYLVLRRNVTCIVIVMLTATVLFS